MKFSVIAAVTAALAVNVSAQKIKVMLLGDSITEITCWRPLIWNQLSSAGLVGDVDFVGSMTALQGKCSRPPGFDTNHEGHSGWQAYDIARNNIAGWVQSTKPDIVQFMLGTNDVNIGKRDVNTILSSYTTIVNAIRQANPQAKIIIDKLIPTRWSDATIEAVNKAIPGWAGQHTTAQSPIVIADCSRANGYTNAMLEGDGVHPNAAGDQFLASQIGPKVVQFVKDVKAVKGGGPAPIPTATTTTDSVTTTATITPTTSASSTPTTTGRSCAPLWAQCGGQGYNGPTCCAEGTCIYNNAWHSNCLK